MLCRSRRCSGGNAHGSGRREGRRCRRRRAEQHARGQPRRSHYREVAPRRIDSASSAKPLRRCRTLTRVRDRGNEQRRSVSLEEPSAHGEREHLATLAGCFLQIAMEATSTHCTAVNDGDYAPTVSRTVPTALAPRLATPAQLEGQPRALLHPKRLRGRARSNTGFASCSSESEDSISL